MSQKRKMLALMVISELLDEEESVPVKRKKRLWMKGWLKKKRKFSNEKLLKHLKKSEVADYRNYLRMSRSTYDELLEKVMPLISKQNTIMRECIPAETRLNITLRFLAKGNDFEDLKFFYAVSPQIIGKIVMETCESIIYVLKDFIKLPKSSAEWLQESDSFYTITGFPNCLGAIDGKHIQIEKPAHSGSYYFNYKKSFSIVLMAVVNVNYQFLFVDVGQNGRVSDGGVFTNTSFAKKLADGDLGIPDPRVVIPSEEALPFVFVGDDAFQLKQNLMKPYSGQNLSKAQELFNKKLSSARVKVENGFGHLAKRFQVLSNTIKLSPEKATKVVLACCYLNNFIRAMENVFDPLPTLGTEERELVPMEPTVFKNSANLAKETRNNFCKVINLIE